MLCSILAVGLRMVWASLEEFADKSSSYVCIKYQDVAAMEVPSYSGLRNLVGDNNVVYKMVLDAKHCADFDSCISKYKGELGLASVRAWGVSFVLLGFAGIWLGATFSKKLSMWRNSSLDSVDRIIGRKLVFFLALCVFVVLLTLFFLYRTTAINGLNAGLCGLSVFSNAVLEGNAKEFAGLTKLVQALETTNSSLSPGSDFSNAVGGVFDATGALPVSLVELADTLRNLERVSEYEENQRSAGVYVCVLCKVISRYVTEAATAIIEDAATAISNARQAVASLVASDTANIVRAAVGTTTRISARVTRLIATLRNVIEDVGKLLGEAVEIMLTCIITIFLVITVGNVVAFGTSKWHWSRRVIPHVTAALSCLVFGVGVLLLLIAYLGGSTCEVLLDVPELLYDLTPRFTSQEVAEGVIDGISFCLKEEGTVLEGLKAGDRSMADVVQQADATLKSLEALSSALADTASEFRMASTLTSLTDAINKLSGVYMVSPDSYVSLQTQYPPSPTDLLSLTATQIANLYLSAHTSSTVCEDRLVNTQMISSISSSLGLSFPSLTIPGIDSYLSTLQDAGINVGISVCNDLDIVNISGPRKSPWGDLLEKKKEVRSDTFRCSDLDVCTFLDLSAVFDQIASDLSDAADKVDQAKASSVTAVNITLRSAVMNDIIRPLRELSRMTNCSFVKNIWTESVYSLCKVGFVGLLASAHVTMWMGVFMLLEFFVLGGLLLGRA